MKELKTEMMFVFKEFLSLMKTEKSSLVNYCKDLTSNLNKVIGFRNETCKGKKHSMVIMSDLLKLYEEILELRQSRLREEISKMDKGIITPLSNLLKEEKEVSEKLNGSVDIISKYNKRLDKIGTLKRTYFDSYHLYEKNVLYDEAINKIVQNLTEDTMKKPSDHYKFTKESKEYEYSTEIDWFNEEAPSMLVDNDKNLQKCSRFMSRIGLAVKGASQFIINYHIDKITEMEPETKTRLYESLDKIDPLLEVSSWIQNAMEDSKILSKIEPETPRSFFTENIKQMFRNKPDQKTAENCNS